MVVVGRREVESETISVRRHRLGDLGQFTMGEFLERILREVTERK
jgi:threonyl-tRNA synthetase